MGFIVDISGGPAAVTHSTVIPSVLTCVDIFNAIPSAQKGTDTSLTCTPDPALGKTFTATGNLTGATQLYYGHVLEDTTNTVQQNAYVADLNTNEVLVCLAAFVVFAIGWFIGQQRDSDRVSE